MLPTTDTLEQTLNDHADQISARIGADPAQTPGAIAAAIPTLLAALQQQAQSGPALQQAIQRDHDGSILDDVEEADWSADGRFLLYTRVSRENGTDLWVLPMTGSDRKPVPFVASKFQELAGRFSPDGRLVAYTSSESGRVEIYLVTFPEKDGKWQVSVAGGSAPRWSADGSELFFRDAAGRLAVAALRRDGSNVSVGDVQPLFPLVAGGMRQFYDVAPDGKRVIVNSAALPDAAAAARPLNVIVNWLASVKK